MRLIDADALKEEVNKKKVIGRFSTLVLIDQAPTVIPDMAQVLAYECGKASVERSQGEWVKDGIGSYRCSLCGRVICTSISNEPYKDYPYCHCGAKMNGGAK